jgi:hypothetical protein
MSDVNLYNLYEHVSYDLRDNVIYVTWDETNPVINFLMIPEKSPYNPRVKYSCIWVQVLKEYLFYELGSIIPFDIKTTYDGEFRIVIGDESMDGCNFAEIGEDGCLYIRQFDNNSNLKKVNCIYNDLVDNGEDPYVPE